MAKKKTQTTGWLEDSVEVPRVHVVSNKQRINRQKWYRRVIWAAVILFPLSLTLNILNSARPATTVSASAASTVDTRARATAAQAVAQWLNSTPSPVYGKGQIIAWDGQETVKQPAKYTDKAGKEQNPGTKYAIQMQKFTITDALGELFEVEIPVAVDKTYGVKVLSTPSLLQVPAADNDGFSGEMQTSSPWPGITAAPATADVTRAIQTWAQAFAGGDSGTLRQVIQDKQSSHTYQTLSNVASQVTTISKAAYLFPTPEQQYATSGKKSDTMIAQVQMKLVWKTAPDAAPGEQDPSKDQNWPTVTYDVLVENANTAAPIVVAWGSPGSGPALKPYENALIGKKDVAAPKPGDAVKDGSAASTSVTGQ